MSTDRTLRYPMAFLCAPSPVSLREGGGPLQSQPLHFFFPGPLVPKPVPGSKPYPSASKPLLTGQGNRPWKLCISDKLRSGWNLSSVPSQLEGQGPGLSPFWAPISSSGKRKELDRRVPREPSSPALLDLNVYIRRVKCLPEHSS